MAKKKGKGGPVAFIQNIVYYILVCGVILGAFKISGITDGSSGYNYFKTKSDKTRDCYIGKGCRLDLSRLGEGKNPFSNIGGLNIDKPDLSIDKPNYDTNIDVRTPDINIDNNSAYKGIPSSSLSLEQVKQELKSLEIKEADKVKYDRKEWNHWIPIGRNKCWNSREEGLNNQAKENTVKYLDKNKKETSNKNLACSILSGEWKDPYSGETFYKISDLDYDHVAPLAYVAAHGGQSWSKEKKEKYANDPEILIVTSAKENRTKGKKGPSEYMPPNKDFQKEYAKVFIHACYKYGISITKKDKRVLEKTLYN